jgi:hypothetical protein
MRNTASPLHPGGKADSEVLQAAAPTISYVMTKEDDWDEDDPDADLEI